MQPVKTLTDRIIHAVLFESIALLICAPVMSLVMNKSFFDAGILVIALACVAMVWNVIFNALFDRLQAWLGFEKTPLIRIWHVIGFEAGLVVAVVLIASWWFSISYWQAFLLEVGLISFFMPYTYVFNLVYDKLRERKYARQYTV
ncbi:multidrug/biocide efflux PACE transporter [Salinimonas lutimaris]|uniref:multidrug/biocide efflux PACE transporter n=1 Tax=Salinimonas lutimaris TaxID=914153 RepID=UPI0010C096D4|nr:multidrug/biocide efflux PACE transporter [Salinimonas lutimaris]